MDETEKKLIREYFESVAKLQDQNIVRSDKVLGDLGEWLCVKKFGLVLEESGRHPGYDGKINGEKVQVKVHNSPERTNLSVGDPEKYDHLIVLIGPRSKLRIGSRDEAFHAYCFTSAEVKNTMARDSGYYCAKGTLEAKSHKSIDYKA
ncbi:hypothetical protein [Methylomonas sp. CM2]|uniref:hypothetical protein n=1 Tax=Methylomonas sp. CM2 TaxID=3417647 RepID=UPI003CF15EFB